MDKVTMKKLNLGSGFCNLDGYENLDGVYGHTLPAHLKNYADNSVDEIFTEHFVEHLKWLEAIELVRECHRILKPESLLKISVPSLEILMKKYAENDITYWGGAWKPATRCAMINEAMREWGHQYIYDRDELIRLLSLGGFIRIEFTKKHRECLRFDFGELFVEARK